MTIEKCDLLFIYGTLLDSDNEFGSYLTRNSVRYAMGKIKGILYDAGEYPAAIISGHGENYIFGTIVKIIKPEITFPVIDEYEGFGENEEKPDLFIRKMVEVESDAGELSCWVYEYNRDITAFSPIPDGIYKKNL